MDELTIDGKVYVSSKRAAALSGYAKDYIGQLCREGRVDSKLVGRSWYVYEPSIREHRFSDERLKGKNDKEIVEEIKGQASENTNIQAVWERPSYTSETFEALPTIAEDVPLERKYTAPEAPVETLSEMQSAWQDWFSTQHSEEKPKESFLKEEYQAPMPKKDLVHEEIAVTEPYTREEQVPLHMIVSDIEHKRPYSAFDVPVNVRTEAPRQEKVGLVTNREQTRAKQVHKKEKKASRRYTVPTQAILIAVMIIIISITLISTGIVEQIHLAGNANFTVFQFLQGATTVNK